MAPHEHVDLVLQSPVVQEALHELEPGLRAAVVKALASAIREARHDERRICAKLAVDRVLAATAWNEQQCQNVADDIAAAIVARDAAEE